MAKSNLKLVLSPSRDIPFDKLVLSQSNVRRIKSGVSIGALAEDIARRTLLQSLNVRPVLDDEAGNRHVRSAGRRPALPRAGTACEAEAPRPERARSVRRPGSANDGDPTAEEDSLAENTHREQLHPLDQFRAMHALVDKARIDRRGRGRFS